MENGTLSSDFTIETSIDEDFPLLCGLLPEDSSPWNKRHKQAEILDKIPQKQHGASERTE